MPTSRNIQVADAIAAKLNAAQTAPSPFVLTFVAARQLLPLFDLTDLSSIVVSVVPKSDASSILTRKSQMHDMEVQIAVVKRLAADTNPSDASKSGEADQIMLLAEQIADYFQPGDLLVASKAWIANASVIDPIFDTPSLRDKRTFLSVVSLKVKSF